MAKTWVPDEAGIGGGAEKMETGYPLRLFGTDFKPIDLSEDFCNYLCTNAPLDATGRFCDRDAVIENLKRLEPEFAPITAAVAVSKIESINIEKHSRLGTAPPTAAQNDMQTSGLATLPVESSSCRVKSSSSLGDSAPSESGFVSAQDKKVLATDSVSSQQRTDGGPRSVGQVQADGAIAAQSIATQSNPVYVGHGATPGSTSIFPDKALQSIVPPEKKPKAPLSRVFTSTLTSGEVASSQMSLGWDRFKLSASAMNQPFKFSYPSAIRAKPTKAVTEHPGPGASMFRSPASTSRNRPSKKFAASSQSTISRPAQSQLSASQGSVLEPPVSDTNGATGESLAQVKVSMEIKLDTDSFPTAAKTDRLDFELDLSCMDSLVPNKCKSDNPNATLEGIRRDIEHAPLLSAPVVAQHAKDLVLQFGFIGNHMDQAGCDIRLFQNTNVPFSAFICGVQGSGKSHTTACMLENALIPSKHLGRLEAPACALVFSYGSWSTGGAGFSVSEAVHLARAQPAFPRHSVRRITVLVSADNGAIGSYYEDPSRDIRVIPFKLNARALDIAGLRALMGVGDKSPPLYMGQVEIVLRRMSATRKDGLLDYKLFKKAVERIDLNEAQAQALKQRLAMLESFLDLNGNAAEPEFLAGEMVIMDLSDAFMSSSTACVLFKLGMDRFLQSPVKSKMVVLDEAHKYMSDSPGSKFLTESLDSTIRLQRHLGTRVIISTQEPTVSTEIIVLCNVSVIHRFTSPTWYAALKRHISALDDNKALMQRIEGLETGEALVYCPSTVLGKNDDGSLVKATGQLLKVNIRKRITQDGGESIMAV